MSASDLSRALPLALGLAIAGCSSPPPGSVDEEAIAADLQACLRRDPVCVGAESAQPAEMLTTDAVSLGPGAKISLPLLRPGGVTKLRSLAMGVTPIASSSEPSTSLDERHTVRVTVTGAPPVDVATQPIPKRLEIDFGDYVPPPGARLEIEIVDGRWLFEWVVGRWNR